MLRLCSDSSRSYPGRSARTAVPDAWGCPLHGNMPSDLAEVSRSHSRRQDVAASDPATGNKPGKDPGRLTPPKGRTKKGEEPQ